MKKNSLLLLACLGIISTAVRASSNESSSNCTSHQFVPRGITTDLVYIDAITFEERHRGWHNPDERKHFLAYATPFYQKSKKSAQLGSAFLLNNGTNTITVAQTAPANVNSVWLGLFNTNPATPFSSTFTIKPQSRVVGTNLYAYWAFDTCWFGGDFWFDVATAVVKRRNTLNCNEVVTNPANSCQGLYSVTTALNNPNYMYGKFFCGGTCNGDKWRTALDDIQFRLGWETSFSFCGCEDNNIVGLYIIGTAPTGRINNAQYIFEPSVGTKNGSIGVGVDGEYLWDMCGNCLSIMTDFNYRYVLQHRECRTFDLTANGPLSRFLLVATEAAPSVPLAGINFFTERVKVTPGSTIQWWIALNYEWCAWNFEIGYDLFWRQREKLSSNSLTAFNPTIGIYDLGCVGAGCTSASTATIGSFVPLTADATFTPLTTADLNLDSARAGKALTNKVYGAIATNGCINECSSWTAALGGSYEFVSSKYRCNALQYWGVFGKLGLNF